MRGEFELIDLLRERIAAAGARRRTARRRSAAATTPRSTRPDGVTATSVDALVDGVHFRRRTFPPRAIGREGARRRAVRPRGDGRAGRARPTSRSGCPDDITEDGGGRDRRRARRRRRPRPASAIAGGDVVASPVLFLAVTAVGHARRRRRTGHAEQGRSPATRSSSPARWAAPRPALLLLERPELADGLDRGDVRPRCAARQLEPRARLGAGVALAACGRERDDRPLGRPRRRRGAHRAAAGVRPRSRSEADAGAAGVAEVAARGRARTPSCSPRAAARTTSCWPRSAGDRLDEALAAVRERGLDPAVVGGVEAGEGLVLRGATGRELNVRGYDQVRSRAPAEPT